MSLWLKWRAQFEAATPPSLDKIHQDLYNEITGVTQQDCNNLATILNKIIRDSSFEVYSKKLVEQIVNASNTLDESMIGEIGVQAGSLKLQSSGLSSAWGSYRSIQAQMAQVTDPVLYSALEQDLGTAKARAMSINGTLNSLRGQILESFLAGFGQVFQQELAPIAEAGVDEILSTFVKNSSSFFQVLGNVSPTKTQGSAKSSVDIIIGDEYIKTISSSGKVDITLPSPFSDGKDWFVSAKNYSSLSHNLHLLGSGSLIGLLSQGMPAQANKYVYNALTIPSAQSGWLSANLDQIKKIFAIQALTGQKANEVKANVLCLSLGNVKNPIRCISTGSLLSNIFNQGLTSKAFIFSPQLESSLPIGDGEPRSENIFTTLNNFTVSVELSKDFLKLNYIQTLT